MGVDGTRMRSLVLTLVDRESVVRKGRTVRVWWMESAAKNGYTLDMITESTFDCHNRTVINSKFGSRMTENEDYKWMPDEEESGSVYPDYPQDAVFGVVCLGKMKLD
jgi:hypothetical protein